MDIQKAAGTSCLTLKILHLGKKKKKTLGAKCRFLGKELYSPPIKTALFNILFFVFKSH